MVGENVQSDVDWMEWTPALDWGHALKSPVIDTDGTVYLVTGDRLVRAISPDGRQLWRYRIPGKLRWSLPRSWRSLTRQFRQRFGLKKNELYGLPLISTDDVLDVNFNHRRVRLRI